MSNKKTIEQAIFRSFVDLAIAFAFRQRSSVPMDAWMNKPFYQRPQVTEDIDCEIIEPGTGQQAHKQLAYSHKAR
jgi:hypothetical protein